MSTALVAGWKMMEDVSGSQIMKGFQSSTKLRGNYWNVLHMDTV